jgi:hypothetical protein
MSWQKEIGSLSVKTRVFLGFCEAMRRLACTNPQPIRNQTGYDTGRR